MAVYNSLVERSDIAALIPEDVRREIIQVAPEQSAVLRLGRRLPNMTRAQLRMPVLTGLVTAGFIDGDTGLKPTSDAAWENKYITAEELAVIIPIPENVLADADYDLWSEIRPRILEAIGKAIDAAILFDVNAPTSWPDAILTGAVAAGNAVTLGAVGDLYADIMGVDGVIAKVEEDGYLVDGHIAAMTFRARLRGLRDLENRPLFQPTLQEAGRYALDGNPIEFPRNGAFDTTQALLFSGDWSQLVYSIRQDVTFKMLTEGVIMDANKTIIYNLPQQDMVALRAVMRLGWQLPNPMNPTNPDDDTRYPFSVLLPGGA